METKKVLPKRLKKEPLLEALFELRFNSSVPASSIIPGILFSKLDGNKKIEKLPASQLPEQVRATDPNLRFAPTIRLQWEKFVVLVSDNSVAVACNDPYPGWTSFKTAINSVLNHINELGIITSVLRYSLKYIDIIPTNGTKNQASLVDLKLQIGKNKLSQEAFQVRLEIIKNTYTNIIFIASNAEAKSKGSTMKKGILIDVDTVVNTNNEKFVKVIENINTELDIVHDTNCEIFFDCLKQETIDALEPIYE